MTLAIILLIVGAGVALIYIWRAEQARANGATPPVPRPHRPKQSRIVDRVERALTVDIVYGDADGVITERSVTVLAVEFDQDSGVALKLEGWCHFRNARRHFRPDRIIEMRNSETGTTIDNPSRYLVDWARYEMAQRKLK